MRIWSPSRAASPGARFAQRPHEPGAAPPVAALPALLLHRVRRRPVRRSPRARLRLATATRRSSSSSCCSSRRRSAASSPASGSPATSSAASRRLLLASPNRSGIVARLRARGARALGRSRRPCSPRSRSSPGWRSAATRSTSSASTRSRCSSTSRALLLGRGRRDAPPDDPGRADDADARLPRCSSSRRSTCRSTLLDGWIHAVATLNPITYVLEAGRSLISGAPSEVALAFGLAFGLIAAFGFWGLRGLRRAEAAG